MLSCEFCEISKNNFFTEHACVTASEESKQSAIPDKTAFERAFCSFRQFVSFIFDVENVIFLASCEAHVTFTSI